MEAKAVAGKTVFFILICLFVVAYSQIFGQENSLTGVIVVVLALMMLGQDLSVRPVWNLLGLVAMTLAMGVGAFLSVWCGNAYVGAVINFALVFVFSFTTTQDLRSPMHFPFLLGYAFMLSVPVTPEGLPMRVLALVLGSVFIVVLNVLINRNRHARTCHNGIASACGEVAECCRAVLHGREVSSDGLDRACMGLRTAMYDRLRGRFFTTPGDHTVLDLVSSLQMAGRAVCERERDPAVLESLISLMGLVTDHENGKATVEQVRDAASRFVSEHPGADPVLLSSVSAVRDGLSELASGHVTEGAGSDVSGRMRAMAREAFRTDSARFTFAVRMSVIFTLWAFVWQNWDVENAKWLLFTSVALIVPYVDGSWRKSVMRLTGTMAGVVVFAAVLLLLGGDAALMSVALIVANYIYTVLDPKRYDVMMVFITFSALIAASLAVPADDAVAERVLFILAGVVSAVLANYLILPYRIGDENLSMGRRYLQLTDRMVSGLRTAVSGTRDKDGETVLALTASGLSAKMHMNASADPSGTVGAFLSYQDGLTAQCTQLSAASAGLSDAGRSAAAAVLDGRTVDVDGLAPEDRAFVSCLSGVVRSSDEARLLYTDMCAPRV